MDDDVGFEVKIDAAEKSQKPELVVQSNLIQGNLTSQMGQMELQEEKGGCWLLVYSARTRGVFSFFFFPVSCKVLRSGCTRIGEVIIVILGVTCEFLVAISKHEIDGCW